MLDQPGEDTDMMAVRPMVSVPEPCDPNLSMMLGAPLEAVAKQV